MEGSRKKSLKERPQRRFELLLSLTYGIPPGELYDRLSAEDLDDLIAYYNLAPWGADIDDLRDARRLMFQAAANGVTLEATDLLLGADGTSKEPIQMSAEEFEEVFRAAAMKQMAACTSNKAPLADHKDADHGQGKA